MSSRRMETNSPQETTILAAGKRYGSCLHPRCNRDATSRGLCNSHASRMWVLIQDGELTEAEAVAHGKMLPRQRDFTEWALEFRRDIEARRVK